MSLNKGEKNHEKTINNTCANHADAISLISTIFAIPPSAANDGATQFSGIGYWATPGECTDAHGDGSDFALTMTGDLAGCLYTFVETSQCSAGGAYFETGNEVYVVFYNGVPGAFMTTYVFTAKYADCANLAGEIFGRCRHPVIPGSGTGIFEGVTGRVDFRDDIEAENFPYRRQYWIRIKSQLLEPSI